MKLKTKFWKVLDLNTNFVDAWFYMACKDDEGHIHLFQLSNCWVHAFIDEESAKKNYCFCDEKPIPYNEVLKLEKHFCLIFKLEDVKEVYRNEIVS